MDGLTRAVLAEINAQAKDGYRVIDREDFAAALGGETEGEALEAALLYLEGRGYIEIRYAADGVYCLRSLPKGAAYADPPPLPAPKGKGRRFFWAAFAGGLAGGLLACLLCVLVFG